MKLGSEDGTFWEIRSVSEPSNDMPGLLYIDGTVETVIPGVSLSGREGNNQFGGGVTVSGGTFHMHGGVIENCGIDGGSVCYGGGVAVVYGRQVHYGRWNDQRACADLMLVSIFPPHGLRGVGGGVFVSGGSSFVMNGGTISGNRATSMGGGIAVVASEEAYDGYGNLKGPLKLRAVR